VGLIIWEALRAATRVSLVTSEATETDYPVTEPDSEILERESEILERESEILGYEAPKPSTHNDCGDSPISIPSLDQVLNNSLSTEEEREDFIKFGKKKANALPIMPGLPLQWIRKHFTELFEQWQKQSGVTTNQANIRWENHPKKEEWLNQ
jgi:hypothetical protein